MYFVHLPAARECDILEADPPHSGIWTMLLMPRQDWLAHLYSIRSHPNEASSSIYFDGR